jgi:hypothetical protein
MKDWEIIADNLHKACWSLGWVSALDNEGRTIWIIDGHRDRRRFVRARRRKAGCVRTGSGMVTLELFASAAAIQPITAALEAGLMEQEQHYPYSAVLP